MKWSDLQLRVRALLFPRRMDAELEDEITSHLEFETRKHLASGLPVEEAARRARVDFGAREHTKEQCRDARGISWAANLAQDMGYAIRAFRRAPGFTGLVILILALAIGANLATFSVTDAIMLRLLPVKDPSRLFRTVNAGGSAYDLGGGASYPLFLEMQKRDAALADLMAYATGDFANISLGQMEPERLMEQAVSGNYFRVLGVEPAAGRLISPEDDRAPGQHPVAVISDRLWRRQWNRAPSAIGSTLKYDGRQFEIAGVAPASFFGVEVGKIVDVWTPVSMAPAADLRNDHNFWLRTMGRAKPGVSIAQAAAPLDAVMHEFMLEDVRLHAPPGTSKQVIDQFLAGTRIKGAPGGGGISYLRHQYEQPLGILLVVVGLVMLIACSNVATLLIARGSARQQEIAIRLSLGAGKARIIGQLLTESLLLASVSAGAGMLVARWTTPILVRLLTPSTSPADLVIQTDLRLLAVAFLLMLVTVLICGLLPALRSARAGAYESLKSGVPLTTAGSSRARRILVTAQVALSLVLVVASGLVSRTLINLLASYRGFNPSSVLVTRISIPAAADQRAAFPAWSKLLLDLKTFPGLEAASLSSSALFAGDPQWMGIRTESAETSPADPLSAVSFVSTGYFSTLGIRLVGGRSFDPRDDLSAAGDVAIVNQAFARKFFGHLNPLGRKLTKLANAPRWTQIVGVVDDVKVSSLRDAAPPMIYIPYGRVADWIPQQGPPGVSMFLLARGNQDGVSFATALNRQLGPRFTIGPFSRQQQLIDDTLVRERLLANVANFFGGLSLLLAGLGLYGITSYAVVQRKQELGVRMALGAAPRDLLSLMLRDAAYLAVLGIVLGLIVASLASGWAQTLLYGLAPRDLTTFIAASLLLLLVSLVASIVPAHRAAKADPMIVLRHD